MASLTKPTVASALSPNTINFQARLENLNGSIVADGTYNIEFKLYNASLSSGSSQGSCTGDANCLWTETRVNGTPDNRVTVRNGYLTVNLGSVTALPTNVWNQQLWLSMRIGGTDASPSWDTEMNPRLLLTAVPAAYALTNTNGSVTSSLTIQAGTGAAGQQDFVLQDQGAPGIFNICIQNSAACGFAPVSGTLSGSYIQNSTSVQTGANFNIDGNGIIGGSLAVGYTSLSSGVAAFNGNVGIGTNSPSTPLEITPSGSDFKFSQNSVSLQSTTGSPMLFTLSKGTCQGIVRFTSSGGDLGIGSNSGCSSTTTNLTLKNSGDLGIGTAVPGGKLEVDAAASEIGLIIKENATTPGDLLELQDSTGAWIDRFTSSGNLILGNNTTAARLYFGDGSSTSLISIGSAVQANDVMLSLPADTHTSDTVCLQTLANCSGSGSGVTTIGALDGGTANANGATISSTTLYLQSASGTNPGLVNTTTQTFAGDKTFSGNVIVSLGLQASGGITSLEGVNITGGIGDGRSLVVGGSVTASATNPLIQIGNAIVGGNTATNGGTYIGLNAPSTGAGSAADFLNFEKNGTSELKVANDGSLTLSGDFNDNGTNATLVGCAYMTQLNLDLGGCGGGGYDITSGGQPIWLNNVMVGGDSGTAGSYLLVQDASSKVILSVDNTNDKLVLGNISATVGQPVAGKLAFSDGTTDNFGLTLQSSTLTANRTYSFPNSTATTDTICLQTLANCGSGAGSYIDNGISAQTANFNIQGAAGSSPVADIEAGSGTGDLLDVGTLSAGGVYVTNSGDLGVNGIAHFTDRIDSFGSDLNIGGIYAPNISLQSNVSIANGVNITYAGTTGNFDQSASNGTFKTGTGAVSLNGDTTVTGSHTFTSGTGNVNLNGSTTVKPSSSTTAFQVQDAAGTQLLTADTMNDKVELGGSLNSPFGGFGRYQNLLTYSEQMDSAAWAPGTNNVTIVANNATAPDGNTTADTATIGTAGTNWLYQVVSVSPSTTYTASWWVKLGTETGPKWGIYDVTHGADLISPTAYSANGNWQRVSFTFTTPAGTTSIRYTPIYDVTSTGTMYVWGTQLEQASTAGTYLQTTAVARTAANGGLVVNSNGFGTFGGNLLVGWTTSNADLTIANNGTAAGFLAVASTATSWTTDSSVGDIVLRTQGGKILLNTSSGLASTLAVSGSSVGIGTVSPSAMFSVGSSSQFQVNGSGAVTAVGVNAGSGALQGSGGIALSGGNFNMSSSGGTFATGTGAVSLNGVTTVKPANNTAAFSVQNSSSLPILKVDTSGGSVTLGNLTSTLANVLQGKLAFSDGTTDNFGLTLQSSTLTANRTYSFPNSSAVTDTVCLQTLANCGGGGSGVTTIGALDGGTANANGATISSTTLYLQSASASFAGLINTGAQTLAGTKTFNNGIVIGNVTTGASANVDFVQGIGDSHVIHLTSAGAAGVDATVYLPPINGGTICLDTANCDGTDGNPGYVVNGTSLQAASFNINGSGSIAGLLTASKTGANALAVIGAPLAGASGASSSLIQIGNAISGGNNTATTGGTYIGLNAPSTGAGSAADLINLQYAGASVFRIQSGGFVTIQETGGQNVLSDSGITVNVGNTGEDTHITGASAISLDQNTTLASGKSLTLTGSGTRPSSPTKGMLYFDTTTNQLIQYNGTKWVSDARTATKIVAASNSSQAEKDAADYVATGSNDATTINSALSALPAAGGIVYLEEGTYTLGTTSVSIPDNTTLAGSGNATILRFANAIGTGSFYAIKNSDTTSGTHVKIQNLLIDGNKAGQTSGTFYGVYFNAVGNTNARDGGGIANVTANNMYNGYGIYLTSSYNNSLADNLVSGNYGGIWLVGSSGHNTLTGNVAYENNQTNAVGFMLGSTSNNNVLSGNVSHDNDGAGFDIYSDNNVLTANSADNNYNATGINLGGNYNSVTGNTAEGNNPGEGIYVSGTYNTVSGNKIHDNGGSSANNGIQVAGSDNTITGNDITDTSCSTTCYAVNITGGTNNYLGDNRFSSTSGTPSINDVGTGTIYSGQELTTNGDALFRNGTNSTTAFQIQNAAGSSLFDADTSNGRIGIGTSAPSEKLEVAGGNITIDNTQAITFDGQFGGVTDMNWRIGRNSGSLTKSSVTSSSLDFVSGSGTGEGFAFGPHGGNAIVEYNSNTGLAYFRNNVQIGGSTSSVTALTIQNASNVALLTADTADSIVKVGTTGSATQAGTSLFTAAAEVSGGLRIGDATNNVQFDAATHEVSFNGTARHTKRINLSPEFTNATMTPDSGCASCTGSMTSDNDLVSPFHNYYNWTTSQAANQHYDIWVKVPIPSSFSAWSGGNNPTIYVYGKTSDITNGTIQIATYDSSGTQVQGLTSVTPGTADTWAESSVNQSTGSYTYTPGGYLTLQIRLQTPQNGNTKLGEIRMDYLSKW